MPRVVILLALLCAEGLFLANRVSLSSQQPGEPVLVKSFVSNKFVRMYAPQ